MVFRGRNLSQRVAKDKGPQPYCDGWNVCIYQAAAGWLAGGSGYGTEPGAESAGRAGAYDPV
ncbi:hypothetical protein D3C74_482010 [compost metagenome]